MVNDSYLHCATAPHHLIDDLQNLIYKSGRPLSDVRDNFRYQVRENISLDQLRELNECDTYMSMFSSQANLISPGKIYNDEARTVYPHSDVLLKERGL